MDLLLVGELIKELIVPELITEQTEEAREQQRGLHYATESVAEPFGRKDTLAADSIKIFTLPRGGGGHGMESAHRKRTCSTRTVILITDLLFAHIIGGCLDGVHHPPRPRAIQFQLFCQEERN